MNSIDRDRKFREAEEVLLHMLRTVTKTNDVDPLTVLFSLIHKTSPTIYRAAVSGGATETADGFAVSVRERTGLKAELGVEPPADHIACMISIDGASKLIGVPIERVRPSKDPKRPSAVPLPDDSGDLGLNAAGIIRFLWDMDLEDSTNEELVARVRAWRERVELVRHACAVLAVPPSLDDLLWEHGNGAKLESAMKAATPDKAGKYTINVDLFDIILSEQGSQA